ncbi:MAG: hypothetical protein ACTHJL_09310 [Amnibacterium sp.]
MRGGSLITAATGGYAVNVALGVATATRLIDTSRIRWVHHALYIVTATLTVAAVAANLRSPAGRRLAPALVPLAVIPYAGTRSRRHSVIAASAAPFYALAARRRS